MTMRQITPFVPCASLARQIAFYRDVLGFAVGFEADRYAFLRRDGVAVRLVEADADVDLKSPERQGSFYIGVDGLDAPWAALAPALSELPEGRVRTPFDQDYGQRDFHVIDEDRTLILFGEATRRV